MDTCSPEIQAQAILDLRLAAPTDSGSSWRAIEDELRRPAERIAELRAILGDESRHRRADPEEPLEIKQVYGRLTSVATEIVPLSGESRSGGPDRRGEMAVDRDHAAWLRQAPAPVMTYREAKGGVGGIGRWMT